MSSNSSPLPLILFSVESKPSLVDAVHTRDHRFTFNGSNGTIFQTPWCGFPIELSITWSELSWINAGNIITMFHAGSAIYSIDTLEVWGITMNTLPNFSLGYLREEPNLVTFVVGLGGLFVTRFSVTFLNDTTLYGHSWDGYSVALKKDGADITYKFLDGHDNSSETQRIEDIFITEPTRRFAGVDFGDPAGAYNTIDEIRNIIQNHHRLEGIISAYNAHVVDIESVRGTISNMRFGEDFVAGTPVNISPPRFGCAFEKKKEPEQPIVYPPMKCACCASKITHPQYMEQHMGREETLSYLEYCKSIGTDPQLYCCSCFMVVEQSSKAMEAYSMMLREAKMLAINQRQLKVEIESTSIERKKLSVSNQVKEEAIKKIHADLTQFKAKAHSKEMNLITKLAEQEVETDKIKLQYEESISKLEHQLTKEKVKGMLLDINPLVALIREKLAQ